MTRPAESAFRSALRRIWSTLRAARPSDRPSSSDRDGVSVVVPSWNAEATIGETLACLTAQTFERWEAIVVDDGSSDRTASVARQAARRDPRIRVVRQARAGVSASRNVGVAHARFGWLCFLDADDLVLPEHLESLTDAVRHTAGATAAYCGSARRLPEGGGRAWERLPEAAGDLYPQLARHVVFPIHACVLRRDLFDAAGGFDTSFDLAEDWDFWLRVARAGARFATAPRVLALYRVRAGSASIEGRRLLESGLRVLEIAERPDPRVRSPVPKWAIGDPSQPRARRYHFLGWCAGLVLGRGEDARPLLDAIPAEPCPDVDPAALADGVYRAALLARGLAPDAWSEIWAELSPAVESFCDAVEVRSRAPWLRLRTLGELRRVAARHASRAGGRLGATALGAIDIAEPVLDFELARDVERICCLVRWEETELGVIELPVFGGTVPERILRDAIASEHAARVVELFLGDMVYPSLEVEAGPGGRRVRRGSLVLAEGLQQETLHSRIGWLVFLQELWGRPDWPLGWFYDSAAAVGPSSGTLHVTAAGATVELAHDLPDLRIETGAGRIVVAMGGVAIGALDLSPERRQLTAQELRSAITRTCGFELARSAVREALVGFPRRAPATLRQRLREGAEGPVALHDGRGGETILGRRRPTWIDTSDSRWARLPRPEADPLLALARARGEPVIARDHGGAILYCPALVATAADVAPVPPTAAVARRVTPYYDRAHFEAIFAAKRDPWGYTHPYEQARYCQALSLLPAPRFGRALDLACAEGVFTRQLASRVDELIAADISEIALARTAERCAEWPGVRCVRLDMRVDPLPERLDLVVCSEVLYFLSGEDELRAVAERIASALAPGGHLLMTHSNLVVDDPGQPGFDWGFAYGAKRIGEVFAETPGLEWLHELRAPLYRIQLFRRTEGGQAAAGSGPLSSERVDLPAPIPERIAATVRWGEGTVPRRSPKRSAVTWRLPILTYHGVASRAGRSDDRYVVSPELLSEHLRYLTECGYYSVGLDDWRDAMAIHEPLPGRAVLITFDDAYADFASAAWPLLRQYGFGAMLFVVAGVVDDFGRWAGDGSEQGRALLGWDALRRLRDDGVEIGSHSLTHPVLPRLSPAAVTHELARARELLESRLELRVNALAFPYGQHDAVVRHLTGATGHIYGLTTEHGPAGLWSDLLRLPRIEVRSTDGIRELAVKLQGTDAPA